MRIVHHRTTRTHQLESSTLERLWEMVQPTLILEELGAHKEQYTAQEVRVVQ
mgnify:CR=1 FL=1